MTQNNMVLRLMIKHLVTDTSEIQKCIQCFEDNNFCLQYYCCGLTSVYPYLQYKEAFDLKDVFISNMYMQITLSSIEIQDY